MLVGILGRGQPLRDLNEAAGPLPGGAQDRRTQVELERPARDERRAASWTESVNTRVFFCPSGTRSDPNNWVSATLTRVATEEPRNRTASSAPHDGQHCARAASASGVTRTARPSCAARA
ncbi:MAG: hypothetical protein ACRDRM_04315 [Pseudonocardiaceae bacterium]